MDGLAGQNDGRGTPGTVDRTTAFGMMSSLAPLLVLASLSPRPHGNTMGDGLELGVEPTPPQPAVTCADGEVIKGIDVSYYQGDIDWDSVAADGGGLRVHPGVAQPAVLRPGVRGELGGRAGGGGCTRAFISTSSRTRIRWRKRSCCSTTWARWGRVTCLRSSTWRARRAWARARSRRRSGSGSTTSRARSGSRRSSIRGSTSGRTTSVPTSSTSTPCGRRTTPTGAPNIADQWADWAFWQFTDSGTVAGIGGPVDTNDFNGSLEDLVEFAGGMSAPCGVITADGDTIDEGTRLLRAARGRPSTGARSRKGRADRCGGP